MSKHMQPSVPFFWLYQLVGLFVWPCDHVLLFICQNSLRPFLKFSFLLVFGKEALFHFLLNCSAIRVYKSGTVFDFFLNCQKLCKVSQLNTQAPTGGGHKVKTEIIYNQAIEQKSGLQPIYNLWYLGIWTSTESLTKIYSWLIGCVAIVAGEVKLMYWFLGDFQL